MEERYRIEDLAKRAKEASRSIAKCGSKEKDNVLMRIAKLLNENMELIIVENKKDLTIAEKRGLSKAMIDRIALSEKRITEMTEGIKEIVKLNDPVGEIVRMWKRPNGLLVGKMRIPLGVILIIYEARPNVTIDASVLCIKSGNAVILRGGSEAVNSNNLLVSIMKTALKDEGVNEDVVQIVPTQERDAILELLRLEQYIDLVIPRGGEGLIRSVVENSRIPVIKHYKGVCHIFVDEFADIPMAINICINAKVQRPAVCNAMETMLVHRNIAPRFLPAVGEEFKKYNVELRGCPETMKFIKSAKPATEEDWYAEYLDLILAIKIVNSLDEAVSHIAKYGSDHTESIITQNYANAQRFIREVSSSTVLVNASTRFSDGYQFGLGAEIGISTTKVHAYGPMGIEELTSLKYIVFGDGQIRV